jgi:hypothetical protein
VQYLDSPHKLSDVNQQQLAFLYEQAEAVNTIIVVRDVDRKERSIEKKDEQYVYRGR